ncbi:unnamed protein product [Pleuronectes platessa]|uniref:Uncharacterized protein n=1 Tax=Pleuronectes platessa TaxID=8262 RepID=A0A9N7UII9_PLEPL|nr:unnamed protein product [Pleuronectes platessa]
MSKGTQGLSGARRAPTHLSITPPPLPTRENLPPTFLSYIGKLRGLHSEHLEMRKLVKFASALVPLLSHQGVVKNMDSPSRVCGDPDAYTCSRLRCLFSLD